MRHKSHVTQLPFTNLHIDSLCFIFLFLLPGRYRDLRRNISLRLVRQRAADCEREHFITEHQPHTMLCHVRGASDNVQQTTCNNFFISSPRLFHFSFIYVICGTWELYLYNFPWFDTTKLCSCALRLGFFSSIQEQWRTPNDPLTPWSEGWPFSNFSLPYQYILKRKGDKNSKKLTMWYFTVVSCH